MANELSKAEQNAGLAVVDPALRGGMTIEIDTPGGPKLPLLKLYQGSAEESAKFGEHTRGVFLDTLDMTEHANPRVVLINAINCWVRWEEGQNVPVYTKFSKADVPAGDLEGDIYGPKDTKPRAEYQVVAVLAVEGRPYPMMYRFKTTGIPPLAETITPLENGRGLAGKVKGCYVFGCKDAKGQGKAYKRLTVRPDGDMPESLIPIVKDVQAHWTEFVDRLKSAASERDDADHIPV